MSQQRQRFTPDSRHGSQLPARHFVTTHTLVDRTRCFTVRLPSEVATCDLAESDVETADMEMAFCDEDCEWALSYEKQAHGKLLDGV